MIIYYAKVNIPEAEIIVGDIGAIYPKHIPHKENDNRFESFEIDNFTTDRKVIVDEIEYIDQTDELRFWKKGKGGVPERKKQEDIDLILSIRKTKSNQISGEKIKTKLESAGYIISKGL